MQNLEIQFNVNIIRKLKTYKFQVDQIGSALFVLFSLYENNIELLDEWDDSNVQKKALFLYKELEIRKLIEENKEEGGSYYRITKLGKTLVEFIKNEFSKENKDLTSDEIAVKGVDVEEAMSEVDYNLVENWIDEWVNIFPRGIKSGGKLVRSDKQSCLRKMKVFLREYPYDRDTIMQATRNYVNSKADENYAYMRCAVYFIFRVERSLADKSSDLASWCDQAIHEKKNGGENSENNLEIMA